MMNDLRTSGWQIFLCAGAAFCLASGCSIQRFAINRVGDALAESRGTMASDDDPELIREALPFSLKLMESLLAESPEHEGLLLALAGGFTQYNYAFVHQEADFVEHDDLDAGLALRERALKLYLRARDYGLRGIEARHAGFGERLRISPREAVARLRKEDVPLVYWTGASWAAAISLAKDDPALIADIPIIEALMEQALDLYPDYDNGAIQTFFIAYSMTRPLSLEEQVARSRTHFVRAVELSDVQHAGPFVALAESVAVPLQNRAEYESLLNAALAVNPDARPEWRLSNIVMQRRARWLLEQTERYFIE